MSEIQADWIFWARLYPTMALSVPVTTSYYVEEVVESHFSEIWDLYVKIEKNVFTEDEIGYKYCVR